MDRPSVHQAAPHTSSHSLFAFCSIIHIGTRRFKQLHSDAHLNLFQNLNDKVDTSKESGDVRNPRSTLKVMVYFSTGVQFALALRVSNLTEASRMLGFLVLPFHRAFDSSLAYVAASALPVGIVLYKYARGEERPRLGGKWSIPKGGKIDSKLLIGSSLFGVGWGLAGLCRKLLIRSYH
jgi:hypothetical protein